ncbi:hypothetical protein Cs7R123_20550 [Catellatospora sp. TT07R-123]|nr:hypothetical protein Cs7R123_20550 [Catellatospora sp. TT07R-123]
MIRAELGQAGQASGRAEEARRDYGQRGGEEHPAGRRRDGEQPPPPTRTVDEHRAVAYLPPAHTADRPRRRLEADAARGTRADRRVLTRTPGYERSGATECHWR